MTDILIVIRMLLDLLTGGDPTLPSGHNELVTIWHILTQIYDWR